MVSAELGPNTFAFYVPMLGIHSGYLPWILMNEVGMEIQDLINPAGMAGSLEDLGAFWKGALSGQSIPLSFHGPLASELLHRDEHRDEALLQVSRAMEVASAIGARFFIAHARLGSLPEGSLEGQVLPAWGELLRQASERNLTLLVENTDEDSPGILRRMVDSLGQGTGLCLDVGHVHRHSSLGCSEWLDEFAGQVRYVHLYNTNSGGQEHHRALGDGEIDMEDLVGCLGRCLTDVPVCLEMDVPQILASVPWLTARGLFTLKSIQDNLF